MRDNLFFAPFSIDNLTATKSKDGLTPLDLIIQSEDCNSKILTFIDFDAADSLPLLMHAFDECHGEGAFAAKVWKKIGAQILCKILEKDNLILFKCVIEEMKLPWERFILTLHSVYCSFLAENCFKYVLSHSGMDSIDSYFFFHNRINIPMIFEPELKEKDPRKVFFELMTGMTKYASAYFPFFERSDS